MTDPVDARWLATDRFDERCHQSDRPALAVCSGEGRMAIDPNEPVANDSGSSFKWYENDLYRPNRIKTPAATARIAMSNPSAEKLR